MLGRGNGLRGAGQRHHPADRGVGHGVNQEVTGVAAMAAFCWSVSEIFSFIDICGILLTNHSLWRLSRTRWPRSLAP
jgi:hypothetical protein